MRLKPKLIILDTETTGACNNTNGNPFSQHNRLCYVGLISEQYSFWGLDVGSIPYHEKIQEIKSKLIGSILCGFNVKFDLHWLRRYGIIDGYNIQIWDCQLAHFIMTGQSSPYPSLNEVAAHYSLGQKIDVIKEKYWENGIDTDQIPEEEIKEYLQQDVMLTQQIFECQLEDLKTKPQLKKLVWYSCQDLLTTAEIEWNGVKYSMEQSEKRGKEIEERIKQLDSNLNGMFPDIPINWNSGYHLSAVLFGGTFSAPAKEEYVFTYKDGRTKSKFRNIQKQYTFPRLVEPIKSSALAKDGFWSTSEDVLKSLKAKDKAKEIISYVLERGSLDTKLSRYYFGFPALYEKMGWEKEILHSSFNHCVAGTGRLSSTKPNIQNLEEAMRECVITRFS